MSAYLDQFSPARDFAQAPPVRQAVLIASTQRCGSSLLGHSMEATGAFGVPLEYLNQQNMAQWKKRFDVDSAWELLDRVERCRTSPNGVFSLKAHYFQVRAVGTLQALKDRYRGLKVIRIVRRDLLRQAISRTVAQQTGVWISGQQRSGEPRYDRDAIAANLRACSLQSEQWDMAFALTGQSVLRVEYEDMIKDIPATLRRIAVWCDIDPGTLDLDGQAPLERQDTGRSAEWADRFRREWTETDEPMLAGRLPVPDIARHAARHIRSIVRAEEGPVSAGPSPNLIPTDATEGQASLEKSREKD